MGIHITLMLLHVKRQVIWSFTVQIDWLSHSLKRVESSHSVKVYVGKATISAVVVIVDTWMSLIKFISLLFHVQMSSICRLSLCYLSLFFRFPSREHLSASLFSSWCVLSSIESLLSGDSPSLPKERMSIGVLQASPASFPYCIW